MKPADSLNTNITQVESGRLVGERPRHAGRNARLGDHGTRVQVPLVRLTCADGSTGFGFSTADVDSARALLNRPLADLFTLEHGATTAGQPVDFPLWDLVAKRQGIPVYRLAASMCAKDAQEPQHILCYDTSLYFDDLHLDDHRAAAALIAHEASDGYSRGHRHFKIKVGRGARHMPLAAGTERDILVIQAVRAAVGPAAKIMIDANNGYNLNLAKQVLAETTDANLFWLEEAFHEDAELYRDLKAWLADQGLSVLIADGEGQASPTLLDWAQDGLIDFVQYDIFSYGFTPWLTLGQRLDGWSVRSAPHHYGRHLGNFIAGHLAASIDGFTFVEWDEVTTPGLDTSAYRVNEGEILLPDLPGFGLVLDEAAFETAINTNGYRVA